MGQGPSAPRRGQFDEGVRYLPDTAGGPPSWTAPSAVTTSPGGQHTVAPAAAVAAAPPVPPASAIVPARPAGSAEAPAAAAQPAAASTAPAAPAPAAAQPRVPHPHKSTTLIPGWSKPLSSTALQIECQRILQPQRGAVPRDCVGVLEMEVMKFVAYCGGVTVKFRVDELAHGPVDNMTWGLASTRACPALMNNNSQGQLSAGEPASPSKVVDPLRKSAKPGTPTGSVGSTSAGTSTTPTNGPSLPGSSKASSNTGMPIDNVSRKPLYVICSTALQRPLQQGDVLAVDLAPREDKQPVIMATLKVNDTVVLQSSLPCSIISSLQMYPFVTVQSGMTVSLHEAVTPSPLFTWYHTSGSTVPEATFAELDTCIKYHTTPSTQANLQNGFATSVDFVGSTNFSSGRHRWTVQLDNYSSNPTHIFVGVVSSDTEALTASAASSNASYLSTVQGPLRLLAGSGTPGASTSNSATAPAAPVSPSSAVPAAATASTPTVTANNATPSAVTPAPTAAALTPAATSTSGTAEPALPPPPQPTMNKWGAWIKLPGAGGSHAASFSTPPPPARDGLCHTAESTSSHCFVTVDLDLNSGYVRFFRNGHLIGSAFQGIRGPLSPAVSFVQAPSVNCQAGLVNLTKLKQLDLRWNPDKCSGDLKLGDVTVSKISEVYGDYSTVLANQGFISGVHLWLIKVNNLSEPDSIFIGVCRGCMPLDQDPQDLRDRTYYLSNGVIRVGGRRVATNAANFTKGDTVGVVLDADQGEIVFFRNGQEQGRARGIRGRLYPFVSCDSEGDQITLLGSYSLLLNRIPRQLADMEWDTLHHASDIELSSNCLTATKTTSNSSSTVRGTIMYTGSGYHEFHVILDTLGPEGVWVGVGPPNMDPNMIVGDTACGWSLHSDGDKRFSGKEAEYTQPFKNGDVLTVCVDMGKGTLCFSRNGVPLGEAFRGLQGPLVSAVTLASEESKITIQNRPTVLNTGEYTGELRWDEARAGKDLHVIDGLTVTKTSNEGGDYATVLGTLCLASGQHTWNVYINHVEDSNLFIGVTVGGHDLNADPQEMKHRTYYLSNGTIRVAGKLITRCAEPYAEGDLVTVQLDMEQRHVAFLKNGVLQGAAEGLPEEVWPYVSLDNIMDSITLHSSNMFVDLAHSLRWNPSKASKHVQLSLDGQSATLRSAPGSTEETTGQATVLGLREYAKTEVHSWIVRIEQPASMPPSNVLVGVAPPTMDLNRSLGEEGCGIGLDYFGYFYVSGRYFHVSNLSNWAAVAKPVRGSTAKHKGKATPIFTFVEGKCEVTVTLDLKEGTLKFTHGGRNIGTIAGVKGPLHAAVTVTSSRQQCMLAPGPIGKSEHTNEELVNILKAKGCLISPRLESALLLIPRDLFVPRDRHREAFRDQKVTVRMSDGSTMTLPPPSFVATALERLELAAYKSFLDVGCGTGYVTALTACLLGDCSTIHGIECVPSRLENARSNMKLLKERLQGLVAAPELPADPLKSLAGVELQLSNVLIPECTDGMTYDAIYCDATLSEEDLPTFLSLLKPNGRMVVIIDEEALLVTRSSQDPHDYSREVITHVSGDFGELEDPTPWEVQEAIQRIKDRERKKGNEQARSDLASLRNFEYVEMQQRVQSAMQRISELESMLQRDLALRSPMHDSMMSPARSAGMDDVRITIKDKSRRSLKPSPRSAGRSSPGMEGSEWKSMAYNNSDSNARSRAKELLSEHDQADADSSAPQPAASSMAHVSMSQHAFEDMIDSMTVQTFSMEQVQGMISGSAPAQVENHDVYHGAFKGVRVRVWKVAFGQSVSYFELKRAYSKYCIAHPNIAAVLGVCIQPDGESVSGASDDSEQGPTSTSRHVLWVVEESFGEESLHTRLERGLLSWQQVIKIARDLCRALAFLQDLKRSNQPQDSPTSASHDSGADEVSGTSYDLWSSSANVLSSYALRTLVTPSNVHIDALSTKVSVLPALLNHLESVLCDPAAPMPPAITPMHCDMAYVDPNSIFSEGKSPSFYAFGVVLVQLLTEQGPLGLLSAVKEALDNATLMNLVPRLPSNAEMHSWAQDYAQLALSCTRPGSVNSLESDVLPALDTLSSRLSTLGSSAMSWEQVEEMLMLPLQPRTYGDAANRRWVRQDFRMRRKMFLEEVAKLAVDGPIHKIEVRRARCFKDAMAVFNGKGHAVWRQPLKVTFIGEAGMDSGGVTREWFSTLSSAIARSSPDLFYSAGPQKNQLYINPMSNTPSHLKKFQFVGQFMAKAILETAARGKELGPIPLSLAFTEPFWKLLLGIPLNLMDLQLLDPTEFRSLMSLLDMDIDGLIFETFAWNFHHPAASAAATVASAAAAGVAGLDSEANTPTAGSLVAAASLGAGPSTAASPFSCETEDSVVSSIPLKPGGTHLKVTNHNKREYVLLKAHKMLVGAIEAQMTALIDAFHSMIPRDLIDKYQFTSLEMQLLVCGEQRIDIADLRRHCKYEDGYNGKEVIIEWFWEVVDAFDDQQRRQLLQFWSGSDGMPAEGFGALDPAFHIVAVERMYDANDTTARLPAAHTCFRQLDLPRYENKEELREKMLTAITIGQGYMALS